MENRNEVSAFTHMKEKYTEMVDMYVPDIGEGETKASQIATAINFLAREWDINGDFWDDTHTPFRRGQNDVRNQANWLHSHTEAGKLLERIWDENADIDVILINVMDRCLGEAYLDKAYHMPKEGTIYHCDGPFRYKDRT